MDSIHFLCYKEFNSNLESWSFLMDFCPILCSVDRGESDEAYIVKWQNLPDKALLKATLRYVDGKYSSQEGDLLPDVTLLWAKSKIRERDFGPIAESARYSSNTQSSGSAPLSKNRRVISQAHGFEKRHPQD